MERAKLVGFSYTKESDGVSVMGDMEVWVDDTDPMSLKIFASSPPHLAPNSVPTVAAGAPLSQEISSVLSDYNDKLLAEIEKLKSTIDDRDEIIGRLAKDLNASNERMMQMFDKAMDALSGE